MKLHLKYPLEVRRHMIPIHFFMYNSCVFCSLFKECVFYFGFSVMRYRGEIHSITCTEFKSEIML